MTGKITTCNLLDVGVHRWFECVPSPSNRDQAVQKLTATLARGSPLTQFRIVALSNGLVLGGMAARRDGFGRLTLWAPYLGELHSTNGFHLVVGALLSHVIGMAEEDASIRYIETKPADDVSNNDAWRALLLAQGFTETACAHVYSLEGEGVALAYGSNSGHDAMISVYDEALESEIRLAYSLYQALTMDRADSDGLGPLDRALIDLLKLSRADVEPGNWRLYRDDEGIVGMVVLGVDPKTEASPREGWIYSIGTVPQARSKGIATSLLKSALGHLAAGGAQRVLALIDDSNQPSIRLHQRAGFQQASERYWIYRKPLSRRSTPQLPQQ